MTHPPASTAVAFLQWGPLHEPNEAETACSKLIQQLKSENRQDRTPFATQLRITEPSQGLLLSALDFVVSSHPNLQVLYLSAHGYVGGLSFDVDGSARLTLADLGVKLRGVLCGRSEPPLLVFGACYALATEAEVQQHMPPEILELVGFTSTPSATNVAELIAAVLKSDEELIEEVTQAAADAANAKTDVAAAGEAAHDAHQSRLQRFVSGTSGVSIRHLHQDSPGFWTGYTIQL